MNLELNSGAKMTRIQFALRRFRRDTSGVMIVEAVIILPVLVLTFIAFAVFWDFYRTKNLAQKATFAIADVISRERAEFRANFAPNYARVFAYAAEAPGNLSALSLTRGPVVVRVTSVSFAAAANPADEGTINMMWSMSSDTARMPLQSNDSIAAIKGKIPAMLDADNVIIVETLLKWQPKFTATMAANLIGGQVLQWVQNQDIETFTTVRPRYVPKACFAGSGMTVACEL